MEQMEHLNGRETGLIFTASQVVFIPLKTAFLFASLFVVHIYDFYIYICTVMTELLRSFDDC